jgi:hypothetical protein
MMNWKNDDSRHFKRLLEKNWHTALRISETLEEMRPTLVQRFWEEVKTRLQQHKLITEVGVGENSAWATVKGWPECTYLSLYTEGKRRFVIEVSGERDNAKAKKLIRILKKQEEQNLGLKSYQNWPAKDGTRYDAVCIVKELSLGADEWLVHGPNGVAILVKELDENVLNFLNTVTPIIRKVKLVRSR